MRLKTIQGSQQSWNCVSIESAVTCTEESFFEMTGTAKNELLSRAEAVDAWENGWVSERHLLAVRFGMARGVPL
jgi:hypothetical protein